MHALLLVSALITQFNGGAIHPGNVVQLHYGQPRHHRLLLAQLETGGNYGLVVPGYSITGDFKTVVGGKYILDSNFEGNDWLSCTANDVCRMTIGGVGVLQFASTGLSITGRVTLNGTSESCTAGAGVAALTQTTTQTNHLIVTQNDVDGCLYSMIETNAGTNQEITISNLSANPLTIIPVAGVAETSSPTLMQYESATYRYQTDRWVEMAVGRRSKEKRIIQLTGTVADSSGNNTYTDVTGLSFVVQAGTVYCYEATIYYSSAATTTGALWSVNGPATTTLGYRSQIGLTATTELLTYATAYDTPATVASTPATTANVAKLSGCVNPSAGGTLAVRMATEVDTSAVTALAGTTLEWW